MGLEPPAASNGRGGGVEDLYAFKAPLPLFESLAQPNVGIKVEAKTQMRHHAAQVSIHGLGLWFRV